MQDKPVSPRQLYGARTRAKADFRYRRTSGQHQTALQAGEPLVWLLNLYVIMSVVVSVSAAFHVGVAAGLYAVLTIAVALIAGSVLKAALFWGDMVQRIGGPVVAALLVILAYWLSGGFSVGLFSYRFTGAEWGAIGFVIAFLWANQRIAAWVLS